MSPDMAREQAGYSGNVTADALRALDMEAKRLEHGTATLTIHIRDGRLARFSIRRTGTFIESDGYCGYVPVEALEALRLASIGLVHGTASITLEIKDSRLVGHYTSCEQSFIPSSGKEGAA